MRSRRTLSARRTALLAERALLMRGAPTASEARLWSALRGRQLGVQFRRQVVIGECIVDFLAAEVRLVVEVDGGSHCGRERADARRDRRLKAAGYRVVRVSAELVMRDLPAAVACVVAAVALR